MYTLIAYGLAGLFFVVMTIWILNLRRVVSTNEVHIVQSSGTTTSYGKDQSAGNKYYQWPTWVPFVGIQVIKLPVSVFSLPILNYDAYDSGRLPFVLDLAAFFRIEDSNVAAQRVDSMDELEDQLRAILQGAARTILASKDIEEIMQGRSEFGNLFTNEVTEQLKAWGVGTVKNIELMDIRDVEGSRVIANIMEKKKSEIDRESRVTVAENKRQAENAEIDASREIEINRQKAAEQVGIRTADKDKLVGIANEKAQQEILEQQKVTTEKDMDVKRVTDVKSAEILKDVNIVKADEQKATDVIKADGEKQKTVLIAEGKLEAQKREAEGYLVNGQAKAESEKLLQLAPVEAQIVLAKEIGENQNYQQYLVTIRNVEKDEKIGIEQAKALMQAEIKVIANSGDASSGLASVGQVLSSKGGQAIASMVEGLAQTENGQALINKFVGKGTDTTAPAKRTAKPAKPATE